MREKWRRCSGDLPVAIGVIRNVKKTSYTQLYEDQMEEQMANGKYKCVDDLLNSGDTWRFNLFKFRMLEKEEKQVREECSRPQRTAAAEAQFPFYFRRGAGRWGSNIKISEFLVKK